MTIPKPLSVNDVRALTGRGLTVIYDAVVSGALESSQSKPGARYFITEQAVQRWVEQGCPRWPAGRSYA